MVLPNPFQIKNTEEQIGENDFLALFDPAVLEMVEERNFTKTSFISSTPGAGKTSLFRAFSPKVLKAVIAVENRDEYKDVYKKMYNLGVISECGVLLASATLSCALNYSIIDEMFQNGRRKQIFFALLNYRIAIVMLRGIGQLLDISVDEYNRIKFADIPSEMISEEEAFADGQSLYRWACSGERNLCQYLDSERNGKLDVSFVHTSLLMVKLFEASNILFDGQQRFDKTLIIFDDFHKLSEDQRQSLAGTIYTLKAKTGVWFGQRLEGVNTGQIISMDGSLNRDYNPNIVIDNYWPLSKDAFYKMLERIADRRVKEGALADCHRFSDCIAETLDANDYSEKIQAYIREIRNGIEDSYEEMCLYQDVLEHIDTHEMSLEEKAIWFECIRIKENRRANGQLSLFIGEAVSVNDFAAFVNEIQNAAKYYLYYHCEIPFYFGPRNLYILSSYNVQQFLVFAGDYFDCYRVKALDIGIRQDKRLLSAEEQMKVLSASVQHRWDDMDLRYGDVDLIKTLIGNIAKFGCRSRDAERASYEGGAYTGVGFRKAELNENINNPRYAVLMHVLGECLASRYLERREINHGDIVVFYLNRWLCVYYKLPLSYGGWKKCSLDMALKMCETSHEMDDDRQMSLVF